MVKRHLWKLIVAVILAATLVAPGVSATSTVFQSPPPVPPSNDNFAKATVISSLPYFDSVNMDSATTEKREPQNCGTMTRTVWYKFSPQSDAQVRISVMGSNYDSNVNVYEATGSKITDLSFVNCASYGNSLTLNAVSGKTYYLQAGFFSSTYGFLQLDLQAIYPPPNDNFDKATSISAVPFSDSIDMTWASTETNEPQYCNGAGQTAWYVFTPTTDGVYKIDLSGFYDTNLVLYQSTQPPNIGSLTYLNCSSWGSPSITFNASNGNTYYIQVGKMWGGSGMADLNVRAVLPPENDNFDQAVDITGTSFSGSVDVTAASTEVDEPHGACSEAPQHTAWYKFTPTANGMVSAWLSGSYYGDTIQNAYRADGSGLGGLSPSLGCTSYGGSLMFNVLAGKTYYFQLGTIGSTGNVLNFYMWFAPAPANDNFADAKLITALPHDDSTDMTAASRESNEPVPSCGFSGKTAWYTYAPAESGSLSVRVYETWYSNVLAVYSGDSLQTLTEVSCRQRYYYDYSFQTFHVDGGKTYYFQATTNDNVSMPFHLEVAPAPVAQFYYYPGDPSIFDTVNFNDGSYDPAGAGIQSQAWDFGDGSTPATGCCVTHKYAKDGDYTVKLTITTYDGRTASTTQVVHVKTHDVAITKFTAPQSAAAGQTRQIVVGLSSKRYPETVQVDLYRSTANGYQFVGTAVQSVPIRPANRTTDFSFNYTFTNDDATIGKVTFRAVATISGARDALPADNEAISPPTKVTR